jgi:hypothetical protein
MRIVTRLDRSLSIILLLVVAITCTSFSFNNATAVEFGQDATGDPNAISFGGSSAFLYSDRIVFTAAHVIAMGNDQITPVEMAARVANLESSGSVYAPGIGNRLGQKEFRIKKVLIHPAFRSRVGSDQTRVNDFAILVLQESIPVKNKVVIASDSDIADIIQSKSPVHMVGYGLQNPTQRTMQTYGTLSPRKMTSYLVSNDEVKNYYKVNSREISPNETILDYGIPNSKDFGSVCDGDSGAGFFMEKGETRYYLGLVGGSQWGIPNCRNESWSKFGIGGGMSVITAAFKYLSLIKEAESLVSDQKQMELQKLEAERSAAELKAKQEAEAVRLAADLKAKQEADAKVAAELKAKQEADAKASLTKKVTIICFKGKSIKTVTAVKPVCPKGYKKK